MSSLLETLLAFAGIMLMLALSAQALQEVLKTINPVKARAARQALESLLREAARGADLYTAADDIVNEVVDRIRRLGQDGVRKTAIRLDEMSATKVSKLILGVDAGKVPALRGMGDQDAKKKLQEIADHASEWFDLASEPVGARYRRRMRVHVLASSALVVFAVNADAIKLFEHARRDPEFRASVITQAATIDTLYREATRLRSDLLSALAEPTPPDTSAVADSLRLLEAQVDSLVQMARDDNFLAAAVGDRELNRLQWWVGILLSTLLVSFGAPFWHDILGTVFALKRLAKGKTGKPRTDDGGPG